MEREATATSVMPARTPKAGQSSSQLMSLGKTVRTPAASSRACIWSSMPWEKSAATTLCPASPRGTAKAPVPQPISNTVSPGRMAA